MTHFPFGVSLIFFRGDFDEIVMDELAAAGVETIEINARQVALPHQREVARRLFSRQRPRASTLHAFFGPEYDFSRLEPQPWQHAVSWANDSIQHAADLGIPTLVLHASAEPIHPQERHRRLERAIEGLALIGEKAKSTGRRLAIEYLPRSCLGNSLAELNLLVDRLGEETFGVCLDVNHLMGQYAELPRIAHALGKRLIATHLSDCDETDEKHWLPGQGVLDWPAFMRALKAIDYRGPFTYECEVEGDSLAEKLQKLSDNFAWLDSLVP